MSSGRDEYLAKFDIIDYARPTMNAEVHLRKMHEAMLDKDYDKALQYHTNATVELRLARIAIIHEKEVRDKIERKWREHE